MSFLRNLNNFNWGMRDTREFFFQVFHNTIVSELSRVLQTHEKCRVLCRGLSWLSFYQMIDKFIKWLINLVVTTFESVLKFNRGASWGEQVEGFESFQWGSGPCTLFHILFIYIFATISVISNIKMTPK